MSEEYLRGCPAEVTAASSAEEEPLLSQSVPMEVIQPMRVPSLSSEQVMIIGTYYLVNMLIL